jgi:hypothetical protein
LPAADGCPNAGSGCHPPKSAHPVHPRRSEQTVRVKTVVSQWGDHGPRPEPAAVNDALFGAFGASGSVEVACTPAAAWRLVTEAGRIGEFSPDASTPGGSVVLLAHQRVLDSRAPIASSTRRARLSTSGFVPAQSRWRSRRSDSATPWATDTTERRPPSGTSRSWRHLPDVESPNTSGIIPWD